MRQQRILKFITGIIYDLCHVQLLTWLTFMTEGHYLTSIKFCLFMTQRLVYDTVSYSCMLYSSKILIMI